MSRLQLKNLEDSISNFNKELIPLIKQRKVDVGRDKIQNLLTPGHFIRYGRSSYIQRLLTTFENFKITPKFTARDYVIASFCIRNGLRASKIIHLRLKGFYEAKTAPDYPGHKVVTISTYKPTTTYGATFLVVPDKLFEHYIFYGKHLRHISNQQVLLHHHHVLWES